MLRVMGDHLASLATIVQSKLTTLGYSSPSGPVVRRLLEVAYLASLKTEEGRHLRGSLVFADPKRPEIDPPRLRRANYPGFTPLDKRTPLSVGSFAKLARAVDSWTGSIAAYGTRSSNIAVWGIVDQIVHSNTTLYRESGEGFDYPGVISININNIAELSVYHHDLFLCGLRQDRILKQENDALWSDSVRNRISSSLLQYASRIAKVVGGEYTEVAALYDLYSEWTLAIARICMGVRRAGTGGALLITPHSSRRLLDISNGLVYSRLSESMILTALDDAHYVKMSTQMRAHKLIPSHDFIDYSFAEADYNDRQLELTGAIKLASSLAALDGIVLMTPILEVRGFGVKIKSASRIGDVLDGKYLSANKSKRRLIDVTKFGTRHQSMLRYCRNDPDAIGLVISQDGNVRVIATVGKRLGLWDDVRLLNHAHDVNAYAREERKYRRYGPRVTRALGYSPMPKTLSQLRRVRF